MNSQIRNGWVRFPSFLLASFLFVLASALVQPVYGQATYTLSGEITGSIGETDFENADFTWTLLGNPASITTPNHPTQYVLQGTESDIDIAGVGDAVFSEAILVVADQRSNHGDVDFFDTNTQEGIGVADPTDIDAWSQPLATSFGPITGTSEYINSAGLATSLGTFVVDSVTDVSFQDVVAPEPGTLTLAVMALALWCVGRKRRRPQAQ